MLKDRRFSLRFSPGPISFLVMLISLNGMQIPLVVASVVYICRIAHSCVLRSGFGVWSSVADVYAVGCWAVPDTRVFSRARRVLWGLLSTQIPPWSRNPWARGWWKPVGGTGQRSQGACPVLVLGLRTYCRDRLGGPWPDPEISYRIIG